MKIGLISDIHANHVALRAVLDALEGVDLILCAGDLTGYYTEPNKVISELIKRDIRFVIGNHDWYIDHPPRKADQLLGQSMKFTRTHIMPEFRKLLRDGSPEMQIEVDGLAIAVFHGSPWNPLDQYIYPDYPHFERFRKVDADVIVLGHTHHPMIQHIADRVLVNPGSCGQPRDNDKRASCAILDSQAASVNIVRVDYNVDTVISSIQSHGLDMRLAQVLVRNSQEEGNK